MTDFLDESEAPTEINSDEVKDLGDVAENGYQGNNTGAGTGEPAAPTMPEQPAQPGMPEAPTEPSAPAQPEQPSGDQTGTPPATPASFGGQ